MYLDNSRLSFQYESDPTRVTPGKGWITNIAPVVGHGPVLRAENNSHVVVRRVTGADHAIVGSSTFDGTNPSVPTNTPVVQLQAGSTIDINGSPASANFDAFIFDYSGAPATTFTVYADSASRATIGTNGVGKLPPVPTNFGYVGAPSGGIAVTTRAAGAAVLDMAAVGVLSTGSGASMNFI